ncbi:MAG: glucokinase [Terrimicrobiaceae bacterium]|nr:glucokinase [Terrimicrobiaceae bacterium]
MAVTPLILAGDIGGTKCNLATYRVVGGTLSLARSERFPSTEFPGLNAIIREYLDTDHPPVLAACFGVPGPVHEGRAKPTNLSWGVDAAEIADEFGIRNVAVLNDLEANAYGISHLAPTDFAIIQKGAADAKGNRCVVSPGTGLGEAGLFWDGRKYHVWACEGGHSDFAPRNDLEIALLQFLQKQYGHVSVERVVSGMGIENIYKFLRETGRGTEIPAVAAEMKTNDPNVVISKYADNGQCSMCAKTLEIFVGCLGAEAGNMALKTMSYGGVFLGGGIPSKLLSRIQSVGFIHAFTDKGRLTSVMEAMPVYVILNDHAAQLGAAYYALEGSRAS